MLTVFLLQADQLLFQRADRAVSRHPGLHLNHHLAHLVNRRFDQPLFHRLDPLHYHLGNLLTSQQVGHRVNLLDIHPLSLVGSQVDSLLASPVGSHRVNQRVNQQGSQLASPVLLRL
ncbi:hypothetical protein EON64_00135 [archaeon]|nr:MAG: hypothetical protein EON64_00135 [archaeon]